MTSTFELANKNAAELGCTQPVWGRQPYTGSTAIPYDVGAGVNMQGSSAAALSVSPRLNPAGRTVFFVVNTLIAGYATTTYHITLNGTTVNYDASTGDGAVKTILAGLLAAIQGNGTTNALVSGSVTTQSDLTVAPATAGCPALVLFGSAVDDYTAGCSATAAGAIVGYGDATSCTFDLYAYMGGVQGDAKPRWRLVQGAAAISVDSRGLVQNQLHVGSVTQLFVQITASVVPADGSGVTPQVWIDIAPCLVGS